MKRRLINGGLLIGILALAALFFMLNPTDHEIFPRCIFYSLSGYYCPGCGSQRAIHSLLHLNIYGVINNNFLFLPAVFAVLYHYLHSALNRKFYWKLPRIFYMKNTPWIIFTIVIVFWLLRNLPVYPFLVLAPN